MTCAPRRGRLTAAGQRAEPAIQPRQRGAGGRALGAGQLVGLDAELVELVWVEIGSKPLADLHPMTRNVLGELERRLATGPLRHDAEVPFYHFYSGKMHRDKLGEGKGA